jgi:hypothetical protein
MHATIAGRWLQGEIRGRRTDRKAAGPRSALKFGSECALADALLFEAKFFGSDGERAVRVGILRPPGDDIFKATARFFRLLRGEVDLSETVSGFD